MGSNLTLFVKAFGWDQMENCIKHECKIEVPWLLQDWLHSDVDMSVVTCKLPLATDIFRVCIPHDQVNGDYKCTWFKLIQTNNKHFQKVDFKILGKIWNRFSWQWILRYACWVGCDGIFSKVLEPLYQPTWRTHNNIHCLDKVRVYREHHLPNQNMQSCHMAFFIKVQCNLILSAQHETSSLAYI